MGEKPIAIEDDLVRRYGEDIRAMPRAWDPRAPPGVVLGAVLGLGALGLVRFMRRRPRAEPAAVDEAGAGGADAAGVDDADYHARIDDELFEVD